MRDFKVLSAVTEFKKSGLFHREGEGEDTGIDGHVGNCFISDTVSRLRKPESVK